MFSKYFTEALSLIECEKYGRARQPNYENITRRMRFACWINKARIQTNNPNT